MLINFCWFDSLIHLQDSQTSEGATDDDFSLITYSLTRLSNTDTMQKLAATFDSLIHLQDSQTHLDGIYCYTKFDSLIHLQDSQTPNYKNGVLTELNI